MKMFSWIILVMVPMIALGQQQVVNIGSGPNSGNGDPLRTAFTKINNNTAQFYAMLGMSSHLMSTGSADAADIVGLFSTCSGVQYLGADGACHAGTGPTIQVNGTNISNQNTPNFQSGSGIAVANPSAGNVPISATQLIRAVTITSDTILSTDAAKLVTYSNGGAIAVTLPQATGSFGIGFAFTVQNLNVGLVTITPTTSTINGASSIIIPQNSGCSIVSDGTNYQVGSCPAVRPSLLVQAAASATSVTPNCLYQLTKVTASATGTFTVNAPGTCTATDGQELLLKVTSPSGGTITYSWNAAYAASATLSLPTTSNAASKEDYFAFRYDADKTDWVFLADNQGF